MSLKSQEVNCPLAIVPLEFNELTKADLSYKNSWRTLWPLGTLSPTQLRAASAWKAFQYLVGEESRVYGLLFKKFFGWGVAHWERNRRKKHWKTVSGAYFALFWFHRGTYCTYVILYNHQTPLVQLMCI